MAEIKINELKTNAQLGETDEMVELSDEHAKSVMTDTLQALDEMIKIAGGLSIGSAAIGVSCLAW